MQIVGSINGQRVVAREGNDRPTSHRGAAAYNPTSTTDIPTAETPRSPLGRVKFSVVTQHETIMIETLINYVRDANAGRGMVRKTVVRDPLDRWVCQRRATKRPFATQLLQGYMLFGIKLSPEMVKNVIRLVVTLFAYMFAQFSRAEEASSQAS